MHTLVSAIFLHPLQKPFTVVKPKAQKGDLNLETAVWALTHRPVPWSFSTASNSPSVQVPLTCCTISLHLLQHFVSVWLAQGISPLLPTKDLDSPFSFPRFTLLRNPAYTAVILKKTALCGDMDVPLWQYYLNLPSLDPGLAPLFIIPLDQCQAAVLLTNRGGTGTSVSHWTLRRVWRSLDGLMYPVNFLKAAAFQKEAIFRGIVWEK